MPSVPSVPPVPTFPLLDRYLGHRLDGDLGALPPGAPAIVETPRRLQREESYGFVHALWWLWLDDGRSLVSVPPGARAAVTAALAGASSSERLFDPALAAALRVAVDPALHAQGLAPTDRTRPSLAYACRAGLLVRHAHGDCRRLRDARIPPAEDLWLPEHCLPDGIVYGIVEDGLVVSVANAHRTGYMEDLVADIGVATAPGYRRRGYAQTVVSAVAAEVVDHGGESLYLVSPDNAASIATARSAGFLLYGRALALAAPAPT